MEKSFGLAPHDSIDTIFLFLPRFLESMRRVPSKCVMVLLVGCVFLFLRCLLLRHVRPLAQSSMASFARGDQWQSMRPNMHFTYAWMDSGPETITCLINAVTGQLKSIQNHLKSIQNHLMSDYPTNQDLVSRNVPERDISGVGLTGTALCEIGMP